MAISVENTIKTIDRLRVEFEKLSLSTQSLLRVIPHFRLDWALDDEFSEEFNIGVTKPLLLSGLANNKHKLKTHSLLFENNALAKLLADTFLIERKLSIDLLKSIHGFIISDGGNFRQHEVGVSDNGNTMAPPFSNVMAVSSNLESLVDWFNFEIKSDTHPLFIATFFHYNLLRIHPFTDGNGRLARVLLSLTLLIFNIPPPIINRNERAEYLTTLRNADGGDMKPLINFIGLRIIESMEYALNSNKKFHG